MTSGNISDQFCHAFRSLNLIVKIFKLIIGGEFVSI